SLLKVAHDWYTENRGSDTYTIRIYESDILYDRIHKWVTSTVDETELRSIIAAAAPNEAYGQSSPLSNDDEVDVSYDIFHPKNSLSASGQTSLDIIYDGSRVQHLNIDGHTVTVRVGNASNGPVENAEKSRIR